MDKRAYERNGQVDVKPKAPVFVSIFVCVGARRKEVGKAKLTDVPFCQWQPHALGVVIEFQCEGERRKPGHAGRKIRGPCVLSDLCAVPAADNHRPIYKIVAQLGLLNSLTSLIIVYTAFNIPFATFLMQSFIDGIPTDLENAAMMDGYTRFLALRKVVFPLALPGLGATLGFVFTAAWSELLFALMLISKNDAMTFPVGLPIFVPKFSLDWGQMMATGALALIPSCLFFIVIQRFLVQGLTSGAAKR